MPRFEIHDTVVLKTNKSLIGTVKRVSGLHDEHNEPGDDFIVLHVDIPQVVIANFANQGELDSGYVFVTFVNEGDGSSVVHQDDLILLSRSFDIGDHVKRPGEHKIGTVINIAESCMLEPACSVDLDRMLAERSSLGLPTATSCAQDCSPQLPPDVHHPDPHSLIYNVPMQELKVAQDVMEGDFLTYDLHLAQVQQVFLEVILYLENNTVVALEDPSDLYTPIPKIEKPVLNLTDYDSVTRPLLPFYYQGWPDTIPQFDPRPGDFVVTSHHTLRSGRWIQGSYDPTLRPQGIVLDAIARRLEVTRFDFHEDGSIRGEDVDRSARKLSLYSGMKNFTSPDELRRKGNTKMYDYGKAPREFLDMSNGEVVQYSSLPPDKRTWPSGSSGFLTAGSRVRFRDDAAAAVKYQGSDALSHGRFDRILPSTTLGWNMNEFKVILPQQEVTVRWEDGTKTIEPALSLQLFGLFEEDFAPTNIVLSRVGMMQIPARRSARSSNQPVPFDEMRYFETPHHLLPQQVGIIQSVDPQERVARVRWFQKPNIRLLRNGISISSNSRLGKIGNVVQDVSFYEIMTFPVLDRRLGDLTILAPSVAPLLRDYEINDPSRRVPLSRERLVENFRKRIGHIVSLDLDGSITVRLAFNEPCRDVVVIDDTIRYIVNDEGNDLDPLDSEDDEESGSDYVDLFMEYEGGERLDDDSNDENWESESDTMDIDLSDDASDMSGIETRSNRADVEENDLAEYLEPTTNPGQTLSSLKPLRDHCPTTAPAAFEVLDRDPPFDQFRVTTSSNAAPGFLKRMFKEHQALTSSLPTGEIYVRTYASRLDLMRCLIIGPRDTPYEDAPFLTDLFFDESFPHKPPKAHFFSWTTGLGKINPNLYEDGGICLSLLGTWPSSSANENWSENATVLQLLLSLQGLVFVKDPFYNEAGFEESRNDGSYKVESLRYTEKAFVISRNFIKHAVLSPPLATEDILAWRYLGSADSDMRSGLLQRTIDRGLLLTERSEQARAAGTEELMDAAGNTSDKTTVFLPPLTKGGAVMLNRTITELKDAFRTINEEVE